MSHGLQLVYEVKLHKPLRLRQAQLANTVACCYNQLHLSNVVSVVTNGVHPAFDHVPMLCLNAVAKCKLCAPDAIVCPHPLKLIIGFVTLIPSQKGRVIGIYAPWINRGQPLPTWPKAYVMKLERAIRWA